jgi:mono/diheme cytochrome c family protein
MGAGILLPLAGCVSAPVALAPVGPVAATTLTVPPAGTPANAGYQLFMFNCAHCHGTDARGDEGPDLHGLTKSDQRITAVIQNGIKGEMPKFSAKLKDSDTQALVAFIRTLGED